MDEILKILLLIFMILVFTKLYFKIGEFILDSSFRLYNNLYNLNPLYKENDINKEKKITTPIKTTPTPMPII